MSKYRKAIAALVGLAVVILHASGVSVAQDVSNQVIAALTALAVFVFPND